jgi:serine/threonine protein kinase
MELCLGSVLDAMRLVGVLLNERQISCILQDCLKGLSSLHAFEIVHRDIKVDFSTEME